MTDDELCELHSIRDRIDRACRVMVATNVPIPDYVDASAKANNFVAEYNSSLYELLTLRARERELMAQPADAEPKCSHGISRLANCADCLDAAHAEGIAQGRRVLAREAFARYYRPDAIFGSPGEMVSDLKGWLEGIAK